MVNATRPASMARALMKPRLTMSRWRSGSLTTFSASSTLDGSTATTSRIPYLEELLALLAQQRPPRGGADRDAKLNVHGRGVRRENAEADRCTVRGARRHSHAYDVTGEQRPGAAAAIAPFRPGLAPAATARTRVADRYLHGHDQSIGRL